MRVYQFKGWITPPTLWGWLDICGFWWPQIEGKCWVAWRSFRDRGRSE